LNQNSTAPTTTTNSSSSVVETNAIPLEQLTEVNIIKEKKFFIFYFIILVNK
jgi:hypothetical protein